MKSSCVVVLLENGLFHVNSSVTVQNQGNGWMKNAMNGVHRNYQEG